MTTTSKCVVEGNYIDNASVESHYTATNVRFVIDKCTITNRTSGAVTIVGYLVESGGSAGATNNLIPTRSILAGDTDDCPEFIGHILENGDSIQSQAGAASSLVIRISGRELSI